MIFLEENAVRGAELPAYRGHNPNINPGLKLEFSMAMRAGHSMVPRGIVLRQKGPQFLNGTCTGELCCIWGSASLASIMGQNQTSGTTENALRLCRTVNRMTAKIREHSVDDIVRGMVSQTANSVGHKYDRDLVENFVYGSTYPRANLQQIDIQRAEEYELNSYDNTRRGFMQMQPLEDELPYGQSYSF